MVKGRHGVMGRPRGGIGGSDLVRPKGTKVAPQATVTVQPRRIY